jgi:spermidine synthase
VVINRRQLIGIASGALLAGRAAAAAAAEEVYESVYNYIIVSRTGSVVALRQMESGGTQSAIDLARPSFQVLPYTRWLFAAALFQAAPARVLGLGLGAGAFNRLFNLAFPDAALTTVEVDPMMLRLAVELTGLRQSPHNQVVIDDARLYLRHSDGVWDWLILDAYVRNSQIPPHLTTVEFFKTAAAHLRPDGVFAVNIVGPDPLFYALVNTLRRVFANSVVCNVPGTGNRIFLGTTSPKPELTAAMTRGPSALAPGVAAMLAQNGVDLATIDKSLAQVAIPPDAPVLTDDFAPSEYLGSAWGRR